MTYDEEKAHANALLERAQRVLAPVGTLARVDVLMGMRQQNAEGETVVSPPGHLSLRIEGERDLLHKVLDRIERAPLDG